MEVLFVNLMKIAFFTFVSEFLLTLYFVCFLRSNNNYQHFKYKTIRQLACILLCCCCVKKQALYSRFSILY